MSGNGTNELRFDGVSYMLDREYRNTPPYQWARELARNGIEATAHNIQFGVEWRGVEATGTYRLQYADDGDGMTREQLKDYMGTLGKGSKVVGGAHDNYALGSRMTLLPWNLEGVVVIAMVDGEANMVKMMYDPDAADGEGAYVLEELEWSDGQTTMVSTVYPPYYDDVLKINWADAIPDLIKKAGHGTTFVLLGRNINEDTLDGDSERGESIIQLTRKYFNSRFWDLPEGVTLRAVEFNNRDRGAWPKSEADRVYQYRTVRGARSIIEYAKRDEESNVASSGVLNLPDGSKAHWWLRRDATVETGGVGSASGFIGVLYRGELYGIGYAGTEDSEGRSGAHMYRQFGIASEMVRRRVFIVIEPPEFDESTGAAGVAPSTGRADLYWMGAGIGSESVKAGRWAEAFADAMPDEIQAIITADHEKSRDMDEGREERMRRVMDRFTKRWNAPRARVSEGGTTTTTPTSAGTTRAPIDSPTPSGPRKKGKRRVKVTGGGSGGGLGGHGAPTIGQPGVGETAAKVSKVAVGLPSVEWVSKDDLDAEGMMAAWQPPSAVYPAGCVLLDKDHPVILGQIEYWQQQYPKAYNPQVESIVRDAYSEVAVAKVSHIHALMGSVIISEDARDQMLENPALTTSLLGLISEDALITPRLGALGAKKKRGQEAEAASEETETDGAAETTDAA